MLMLQRGGLRRNGGRWSLTATIRDSRQLTHRCVKGVHSRVLTAGSCNIVSLRVREGLMMTPWGCGTIAVQGNVVLIDGHGRCNRHRLVIMVMMMIGRLYLLRSTVQIV